MKQCRIVLLWIGIMSFALRVEAGIGVESLSIYQATDARQMVPVSQIPSVSGRTRTLFAYAALRGEPRQRLLFSWKAAQSPTPLFRDRALFDARHNVFSRWIIPADKTIPPGRYLVTLEADGRAIASAALQVRPGREPGTDPSIRSSFDAKYQMALAAAQRGDAHRALTMFQALLPLIDRNPSLESRRVSVRTNIGIILKISDGNRKRSPSWRRRNACAGRRGGGERTSA